MPAMREAERPRVAPFTVLCLSTDDAVVLVQPKEPRAGRRFAADLLAAATGVWSGEQRQLLFEWPQPGIENDEAQLAKALVAFVRRQLEEHADALILIGAEVADRIGSLNAGERLLVLPELEALMTDGVLKRSLWEELHARSNR